MLGQIEWQRAKGRNRINQHTPPGLPHRAANARYVIHNAAAGFAIDQGDMPNIGIRREHRGNILSPRAARIGQVQRYYLAPRFARQPRHTISIGAIHGNQNLRPRWH